MRFIELDIARGVAIVGMIFYHIIWDLSYLGIMEYNFQHINTLIPALFLFIVGICLSISYENNKSKTKILSRGGFLIGVGIFLSAISLLIIPDRPIYFGILHCIGTCIILSLIFYRLKYINLLVGAGVFLASFVVPLITPSPTIPQLILGFHPSNPWLYTIDYFPLIPWIGVVMMGFGIGSLAYKNGQRQFHFPHLTSLPTKLTAFIGRHSLKIYLIHQPIIYCTLKYIYFGTPF